MGKCTQFSISSETFLPKKYVCILFINNPSDMLSTAQLVPISNYEIGKFFVEYTLKEICY